MASAGDGSVLHRLSQSLAAQAVSSLTNFALGLFLVRSLAPQEFGLFGVGQATTWLLGGFVSAVFLTQIAVEFPGFAAAQRLTQGAALAALLAGAGGLVMGTSAIAWWALDGLDTSVRRLVPAVGVLFAAGALRDLAIALSFIERKGRRALTVNLVIALALSSLVAGHVFLGGDVDAADATYLTGAATALGALVGLLQHRLPLRAVRYADVRNIWHACWLNGRWAFAQNVVQWLQTQSYAFLVNLGLGAASLGLVNASRLLIAPLLLLFPPANQVAIPRLAELRGDATGGARRFAVRMAAAMVGLGTAYTALVLLAYPMIVPVVFGASYRPPWTLMAAWGGVFISRAARNALVLYLQSVRREFRLVSFSFAIGAPASILGVVTLGAWTGPAGCVLGMVFGEIVSAALLAWLAIGRNPRPAPAAFPLATEPQEPQGQPPEASHP